MKQSRAIVKGPSNSDDAVQCINFVFLKPATEIKQKYQDFNNFFEEAPANHSMSTARALSVPTESKLQIKLYAAASSFTGRESCCST